MNQTTDVAPNGSSRRVPQTPRALAAGIPVELGRARRPARAFLLLALVAAGCSGGGGSTTTPTPGPDPLLVGGTLAGLTGGSVVLEISGGERLELTADGDFLFQTAFALGAVYEVSLVQAPQKAFTSLSHRSGLVTGQVRDVAVAVEPAFTVAGQVTGLEGDIVLELNGQERVQRTGPGPFAFATLLRDGQPWTVTVVSAPVDARWTLTDASGTVAGTDIGAVAVDCEHLRRIRGTVRGLQGGLVLQNAGTDDLVVAADGPFVFPSPLAKGSTYDVQALHRPASQRVRVLGGAGTVGDTDVLDIEVVCEEKAWTHPATVADNISMDGNDADSGSVASGLRGDAVIAWEYGSRIYCSERRDGRWAHPVRDQTPPHNPAGGSAFDPRMAVGAQGEMLLLWAQRDVGVERIYASTYRNGTWSDPLSHADHLSALAGDAQRPKVAIDASGTGYAVWEQYVGGNGRVFASIHDGVSWTRPALNDAISPDSTHAQDVDLAVSPAGHVVVVWSQNDYQTYRIFKSERRNGVWTHPANLADCISPAGSDAFRPSVAFDGNGNALVAWIQSDGTHPQVFTAECRNGTWRRPRDLNDHVSPAGSAAHVARAAKAGNGDAILVWRQDVAVGRSGLLASQYRAGAWTHPATVGEAFPLAADVLDFDVRMDSEGNAVVVYTATDGVAAPAVFLSEFRRGAWQHPAALADHVSPAGDEASLPRVSIDGNDDVLVLWRQDDGTFQRAFLSEYR